MSRAKFWKTGFFLLPKKLVSLDSVMKPIRPYYSQAVIVENPKKLIFVSGQSWNPKLGGPARGDPIAQTEFALNQIKTILESEGAKMDDVVKVTVYVRNLEHLDQIAEARYRYFSKSPPSSVIVEVSKLWHPDLLVEIDAIAAVG
jgi:2-iminobutanoate/2-iminopropanoate deaminase